MASCPLVTRLSGRNVPSVYPLTIPRHARHITYGWKVLPGSTSANSNVHAVAVGVAGTLVNVFVGVCVEVGVLVRVDVLVEVFVGALVGTLVAVYVGVLVRVLVGV